jgi:hypothetical protein
MHALYQRWEQQKNLATQILWMSSTITDIPFGTNYQLFLISATFLIPKSSLHITRSPNDWGIGTQTLVVSACCFTVQILDRIFAAGETFVPFPSIENNIGSVWYLFPQGLK